jgi:hypothetical protein
MSTEMEKSKIVKTFITCIDNFEITVQPEIESKTFITESGEPQVLPKEESERLGSV